MTSSGEWHARPKQWGKDVSIITKSDAYLAGSIEDYERTGREPTTIQTTTWVTDNPIGSTFGSTSDMTVSGPATVINDLVNAASKNGTLPLNLSPTGGNTGTDGSTSPAGCTAVPVTPNATQQARNVLCYLYSQYGNHILSGQEESGAEVEINYIYTSTQPQVGRGDHSASKPFMPMRLLLMAQSST